MYEDGWMEYKARSNRQDAISNYFNSKSADDNLVFQKLHRVLSVGSGNGEIDKEFLHLCSSMEDYTCLEPNEDLNAQTIQTLSSAKPSYKLQVFQETFETFNAPEGSYDAVLFIHSVYYFLDDLGALLEKALKLLKKGGKILFITGHGTLYTILEDYSARVKRFQHLDTTLRECVTNMELNFVEERIGDELLDLKDKGCGYYDFLDFIVEKELTKEQKLPIVDRLKLECLPNSTKFGSAQSAFIITK